MIDWGLFLWAAAAAAALIFIPGYLCARALRLPARLSITVAPACTAGVLGTGAVVASWLAIPWQLWTAVVLTALTAAVCCAFRCVCTAPAAHVPALVPHRLRVVSCVAVGVAALITLGPIVWAMPGPDALLQRWDALHHLSAIQYVHKTGSASSLELGGVAFSYSYPSPYPAAFHAITSLIPWVPVPIAINGAVFAMACLPWALGHAVLARVLWPRVAWAPCVAATVALIAPAAPINEWVHLSPTPNLVGFSFLPGVVAFLLYTWRELIADPSRWRTVIPLGAVAGLSLIGLVLTHPNVLLSAAVLAAVGTIYGAVCAIRRHCFSWPHWVLPILSIAPIAIINGMPGSEVTGGYVGGLQVPLWQGAGEVGLGLLTVWPMALGVLLWGLAWVGVWACARRGSWLPLLCAAAAAILYLDAAVDSPLGLTALWYRGQDRISMLVTLVVVPLVIAGIAHVQRLWRARVSSTPITLVALTIVVACAASSVPTREHYAALNFELDMPLRNRFFDAEELAMLKRVGPTLDTRAALLASPFSGAVHLYGLYGQSTRFQVPGQSLTRADRELMKDARIAPSDPAACARLTSAKIDYVYVDSHYYNYIDSYDPLLTSRLEGWKPIAQTEHSALYKVECGV